MKRLLLILPFFLLAIPAKATGPITEITASECAAATITCTPGTVAVGDLEVAFAYRSNNATAPAAMTGFTTTSTACGGANSNSCRVGCAVATSTVAVIPSSTNATEIILLIFRGTNARTTANCTTTGLGGTAADGNTGTSISYDGVTLQNSGGSAFVIGCAGHVTATNVSTQAPTGMTLQQSAGTGPQAACFRTTATAASWTTQSVTVNASSGWRSYTAEIIPNGCSATLYGSYTCVQSCVNKTGSGNTTVNCVMPSNVTSGNFVDVMWINQNATSLTLSGCAPVTFTTPDAQVGIGRHGWGKAGSTAACTITGTSDISGQMSIVAVEIGGSSGTVDQHSMANQGSISSGVNIPTPSVTTTHNGEFIISEYFDNTGNGAQYTQVSGNILVGDYVTGNLWGIALQGQSQTSAGAIVANATGSQTTTEVSGVVTIQAPVSGIVQRRR